MRGLHRYINWTLLTALLAFGMSSLGPASQALAQGAAHRFMVKVNCHTQEGRAVSGVVLQYGSQTARTDSRGMADLAFDGKEGDEVTLRVEKVPSGMELADRVTERHVVLKRYGADLDGLGGSVVPHDIMLRNRKDSYVVMVYAERAANLPVLANGKPVSRLNSRGASMFRYEAKPGEELVVGISTQDEPRANTPNPKKVFKLSSDEHLLLFHSELTVAPVITKKLVGVVKKRKLDDLSVDWGKRSRKH